jgi:hypothetical protein
MFDRVVARRAACHFSVALDEKIALTSKLTMLNKKSVSVTTTILAALCNAAVQRPLPFSKAGKNLVIASKTSKREDKAWFIDEITLSLSMSMPSVPIDEYTEFGSPLFNPSQLSPSGAPSYENELFLPSKSPSPPFTKEANTVQTQHPTWLSLAPTADNHHRAGIFNTAPPSSGVATDWPESIKCSPIVTSGPIKSHVKLHYYYRMESSVFNMSAVDEIEHLLLDAACKLRERDRALRSVNVTAETIIEANASPSDAVSNTCESTA